MSAPATLTFAQKYPAYTTPAAAAICAAEAARLRASIATRRAARQNKQRVELALATISPTAKIIPFPGASK